MRPAIRLLAIAIAITAIAFIVKPDHGRAITIGNGTGVTLEGQNICGGPPTAGNYLGFNSGQWCDTAGPITFVTTYLGTTNGLLNTTVLNLIKPTMAMHITRFTAQGLIAGGGCATAPQVCITNPTLCIADTTLTLANGTVAIDSGAINDAVAAGTTYNFQIARSDSGCTTHPQAFNLTLQLSTP